MNTARIRSWHAGIAATGVLLCLATAAGAQDDGPARGTAPTSGVPAWFSLPLPPKPGATPAVVVGTRGPRSVTLPPGEAESPEFDGATILEDLKADSGDCHREPQVARDWRRAVVGPRLGLPLRRGDGPVGRRALPQGRPHRRQGPAHHAAGGDRVLAAAVVGSPAARRSGLRRRQQRHRARVGDAAVAVGDCRRHADGAARLRRQRQPGDASSTSTSRARSPCSSIIPQAHMVFERDYGRAAGAGADASAAPSPCST